jgi:hypothetical protein
MLMAATGREVLRSDITLAMQLGPHAGVNPSGSASAR